MRVKAQKKKLGRKIRKQTGLHFTLCMTLAKRVVAEYNPAEFINSFRDKIAEAGGSISHIIDEHSQIHNVTISGPMGIWIYSN